MKEKRHGTNLPINCDLLTVASSWRNDCARILRVASCLLFLGACLGEGFEVVGRGGGYGV